MQIEKTERRGVDLAIDADGGDQRNRSRCDETDEHSVRASGKFLFESRVQCMQLKQKLRHSFFDDKKNAFFAGFRQPLRLNLSIHAGPEVFRQFAACSDTKRKAGWIRRV